MSIASPLESPRRGTSTALEDPRTRQLDPVLARLVLAGRVSADAAVRAMAMAQEQRQGMAATVTGLGLTTSQEWAEAVAQHYEFELVPAEGLPKEPLLADLLSPRFVRHAAILPIRVDADEVRLAMADPGNSYAVRAVGVATGRRVVPVIAAVRARWGGMISVDTMKPMVARAAVAAGATMWNDVTALTHAPDSAAVAAELGCEVVLMHMKGEPRTMQCDPRYDDVVGEVRDYLSARAEGAMAAGVARQKIWLDPGIGFGKTLAHNMALTAGLNALVDLGFPVLYAASRKRTIQAIDATAVEAGDRLGGSIALALEGARRGARMVRVHDVRETIQALQVQAAVAMSL